MGKLVLIKCQQLNYDAGVYCAYLAYGDVDKPLDHKDRPFTADTENEFRYHIVKTIQPMLAKVLTSSHYSILNTDIHELGLFPSISIKRNDGNDMTVDDEMTLKGLIIQAISNENAKYNRQRVNSRGNLFANADIAPPVTGVQSQAETNPQYKR